MASASPAFSAVGTEVSLLKVSGKKAKASSKKLAKKAQIAKRAKFIVVKGAKGSMTYKASRYVTKAAKGKISVTKVGNVKVKKGTKKGACKLKIKA